MIVEKDRDGRGIMWFVVVGVFGIEIEKDGKLSYVIKLK